MQDGFLRDKEVINVKDGGRIGFVCDVEVDTQEARLTAVVVYGKLRLFGLLGREADFVIPWGDIAHRGGHGAGALAAPRPKPAPGTFSKLLEKIGF